MLELFMKELAKELELKPIKSDRSGTFKIPVGEEITILISRTLDGFNLNCTVGSYPTRNDAGFLTEAMLANLMGQGTNGAVLGLSLDGSQVTLAKTIDYKIEYKDFKEILTGFINSVDFWREEMLNYS
jgi:hypothetical protein